jgi:hypothetical protein
MHTSYNGWPASDNPHAIGVTDLVVDGVAFPAGVKAGDVHAVFEHFVTQYVARVEPLIHPGCWGYNFRPNVNDPSQLSCHASATAIDLNAPKHPNDTPARRSLTVHQIGDIHQILAELEHVIRWGGDFHHTIDPMHFEIFADAHHVARVATKIRGAHTARKSRVTLARELLVAAEHDPATGEPRKHAIARGLAALPVV